MAILSRKIAAFFKKIGDLPDRPGGTMTTAELKAQFDSSPEELRVSHNGLIDDLASVTAGSSGAEQIGSAPIAGVSGSNAYAQIADLKSQINQATTAQILPASITEDKLAFPVVRKDGGTMTGDLTTPKVIASGGSVQSGLSSGIYAKFRNDGYLSRGNNGVDGAFNNLWDEGRLRVNVDHLEWNKAGTWQGVGGVKSVQRGITSVGTGATVNVPISAVDFSKSFVTCNVRGGVLVGGGEGYTTATGTARLSSSTNVELTAGTANAMIAWEVVESY